MIFCYSSNDISSELPKRTIGGDGGGTGLQFRDTYSVRSPGRSDMDQSAGLGVRATARHPSWSWTRHLNANRTQHLVNIAPRARRILSRTIKRSTHQRGRRKLGWDFMRGLTRFLPPVTIYRLTGRLPFAPFAGKVTATRRYEPSESSPRYEYRAPQSADDDPAWNIFPVRVPDLSELVTIDHGIALRTGHVLDRQGLVVPRAIHKKRYHLEPGWTSDRWPAGRRIPAIRGTVASIAASTQWNYYHWLFDILPRLSMLLDLKVDFDRLYLQRAKRFQAETLSIIGLSDDVVLDCDETPIFRADRLLVPCHQTTGRRRYPVWVSERLRQWFLPGGGNRPATRRLYVARSAEYGRGLANEDEIVPLLESLGFEYVLPERLPFAEQVRLFREAEVVVAPHGAGLANIVFCNPDTAIIELFPPDMKYTYYKISQTVGLRYYFARASGEQGRVMSRGNFHVTADRLLCILAMAGVGDNRRTSAERPDASGRPRSAAPTSVERTGRPGAQPEAPPSADDTSKDERSARKSSK